MRSSCSLLRGNKRSWRWNWDWVGTNEPLCFLRASSLLRTREVRIKKLNNIWRSTEIIPIRRLSMIDELKIGFGIMEIAGVGSRFPYTSQLFCCRIRNGEDCGSYNETKFIDDFVMCYCRSKHVIIILIELKTSILNQHC